MLSDHQYSGWSWLIPSGMVVYNSERAWSQSVKQEHHIHVEAHKQEHHVHVLVITYMLYASNRCANSIMAST